MSAIYILFDWDDRNSSGWLGPYNSGEKVSVYHLWKEQGTYEIRVKAIDTRGDNSEWSDPLVVSMPKNKSITFIPKILIWLFERFPFLQPYFSFLS